MDLVSIRVTRKFCGESGLKIRLDFLRGKGKSKRRMGKEEAKKGLWESKNWERVKQNKNGERRKFHMKFAIFDLAKYLATYQLRMAGNSSWWSQTDSFTQNQLKS